MNFSERPILVMCMGRSGSSVTTKIFAEHGAWVGNCHAPDKRSPSGYYENRQIKALLNRKAGRNLFKIYDPDPEWRGLMASIVPQHGKPWAVKHSVIFWRLWSGYKDPFFVLPRRRPEAVFKSVRKGGFCAWMSDPQLRDWIQMHHDEMDWILETQDAVEIDTTAMIGGERDEIQLAIKRAGLIYQEDIVDAAIDPRHWHHI